MSDLKSNKIPIILLNVSVLNTPIKGHKLAKWI